MRLRAQDGAEQVVLASYLMAAPDFAVTGGVPVPGVEPFGLPDGLSEEVLTAARDWERHVVEVETGLAPDAEPGTAPRPEYDPKARTLAQRTQAKADELGAGVRTIDRMRAQYGQQGLWGLVDRRAVRAQEATGRADAWLVAVARQVIEAETHASTGTRGRLIRRITKAVEDAYGPGIVPLPGRSAFYKLIDALAAGRHTFGSAVTRRQAANRPDRPFTPTFAARPGEQVQIDSTPIDVMVLLESGMPARADLTIAVHVATRTICAAVLRPVGTKAVDAALLLARMLVPEPMRPGWAAALRMSASRLPHARLLDVDARMELAAARPVIVPDTIVIDGGRVFMSDTFIRACDRLGISVQNCRPRTPTDNPQTERLNNKPRKRHFWPSRSRWPRYPGRGPAGSLPYLARQAGADCRGGLAVMHAGPAGRRCFPSRFPAVSGIRETLSVYPFCALGYAGDVHRLRPAGGRLGRSVPSRAAAIVRCARTRARPHTGE